jgi:hypothetical protein
MKKGPGSSYEGVLTELVLQKKEGWSIKDMDEGFIVTIPKHQDLGEEAWWIARQFGYREFTSVEYRCAPDPEYWISSRAGTELRFVIQLRAQD